MATHTISCFKYHALSLLGEEAVKGEPLLLSPLHACAMPPMVTKDKLIRGYPNVKSLW